MTELIFQKDAYVKEFDAKIVRITDKGVILDRTAFNPRAGGLEGDKGTFLVNENAYNVLEVIKDGKDVVHVLDTTDGLKEEDTVHGEIDWGNRYRQMRLHTATHIVSAVFYEKYNALVTGGHITSEKAKELYDVEQLTTEMIDEVFSAANEIVRKALPVKVKWLTKEEAIKIPGVVKLASKMPPSVNTWRIVEIPGVDVQADGGPHVKNTEEVGTIVFLKKENKGKGKKAIHFTVEP